MCSPTLQKPSHAGTLVRILDPRRFSFQLAKLLQELSELAIFQVSLQRSDSVAGSG